MSTLKSWEETKKELKKKGIEKEKIKMAFRLMERIKSLDRIIFPENPRPFRFIIKESHSGQSVAYGPDSVDEGDRFYFIILENLSKNLTEEKKNSRLMVVRKRKIREQSKLPRYTWEELFMAVAAHEVRHRVQLNFSIKRFSPEVASSVDDQFLQDVIKLVESEFNWKRQILINKGKTKKYIEDTLGPMEFDAEVIEKVVAYKVHKKAPLDEIISTIQMQAP